MEPRGERMVANDVVEDDLQGPRSREAHCRLDQHREKNDHQSTTVGSD